MPGNYGNKKKKNNKKEKPPVQKQGEKSQNQNQQKPASSAPPTHKHSDSCCAQSAGGGERKTLETTKASQLPPIIAVKVESVKQFIQDILTNLNLKDGEFICHNSGGTLRVTLCTLTQYKKMIKYLVERKIHYFTYTRRDEKPFSYVVKNLPTDLGEMSVKLAFVALKFNVIKLRKISKTVWFLQLKSKGNTGNITKVKRILDHDVTIEKFKRKFTIQCKNCQRLGHAAFNCCFEYRCVKCSESHDPGQCSIPKRNPEDIGKLPDEETKLKCALCGEGHAANYKDCTFKATYEQNKIKQFLLDEMRRLNLLS